MLGIIFGAAGMLLVYYTVQAVFGPVDKDFYLGYYAGDFSIFANYTVREVKEIGRYLDIPSEFIDKVPEDGLSGLTDEDNLGFTYEQLDRYLNDGIYPDYDTYKNIEERHKRNLHKIRRMPTCPNFNKYSRYDDI